VLRQMLRPNDMRVASATRPYVIGRGSSAV
jgi:hypothetical protein